MKRILLSGLLAFGSTSVFAYSNITQQQAHERALQIGDVSYQLSIEMEKNAKTYLGTNVIKFNLKHNRQDVVIDFNGREVEHLKLNGKKISSYQVDAEDENIILPKKLFQTGKNQVTISYVGEYGQSGVGFHQFVDPEDGAEYYYTDFQPANAHSFFPHFDQPDIKATYRLDVKAPQDWRVLSNAPLESSNESGELKHSQFKTSKLMPSYIMHLSVGPYAMWEDNTAKYPMAIYARRSLAKYVDPAHMFETTKKGFDIFESYYDYPYPFEKYDQIFVPEFNAGAMENAGAVTFTESYIFRSKPTRDQLTRLEVTIFHEMAHMWFGDLVTMKWWNDLWLNESFADFMGYVGIEGMGDKSAWTRAARRKGWAYYEDQLVTTHPIIADAPDILTASSNFDGITYAKGLAVLRQLEYFIGSDTFRKGIRHYFKQHAYKNTTLKDFMASLEYAHGESLQPWADKWLASKDVNSMRVDYQINNGKIANAKVFQFGGQHNPELRPHANLIGLYYQQDGELVLKDKIKVIFDGKETQLPQLNGKAAPAVILPNVDDYDYVKIRFDKRSLSWLKANIEKVKDTKTKMIIWDTLWDMVRDQELKANDYYAMLVEQLPMEQDASFLSSQLESIGSIFEHYMVDAKTKEQGLNTFFTMAKKLAKSAKAGSDLQRTWFEVLIFTARQPNQINYIVDLFDNKEKIAGIEMNHKYRWDILRVLSRLGYKSKAESRVNELLKQDKSARGKNYALRVSASQPDAKVKRKYWDSLVGESDYSLTEKRAIGRSLFPSNQAELMEPYIDQYFDKVKQLQQQGGNFEWASFFIGEMYPEFGYERTVAKTEKLLQSAELPPIYRKLVLKQLDELKRTVAIRNKNG